MSVPPPPPPRNRSRPATGTSLGSLHDPIPAGPFAADRLRSHRGRYRSSSHEQAHGDEEPGDARDLPDHRLISREKPELIADAAALARLVDELRATCPQFGYPCFAYDSEFIGESTYSPRLCLIQVATSTRLALIDPLAGVDLAPFWALVGEPGIRKLVHAGEQDLEPAARTGIEPANVFDTQIAAGFCALPYPTSLAKLVEHVTGVRLGKGLTFTQWDQRPLSKRQLAYAADDVRFLPAVTAALDDLLAGRSAGEWAEQECRRRFSMEALLTSGEAWERVKGAGSLSGKELAILRELALWRDEAAREQDLPPRALVRDEVLLALARRPGTDLDRLGQIKHMPRPVAERFGEAIMAAVARGREAEPIRMKGRAVEPTLEERFAADAAWALLQTIATAQGIDPNLIASRRETETFSRRITAGKKLDRDSLMHGWRRRAAGELLAGLIRGESHARLAWLNGRLTLTDTTSPPLSSPEPATGDGDD